MGYFLDHPFCSFHFPGDFFNLFGFQHEVRLMDIFHYDVSQNILLNSQPRVVHHLQFLLHHLLSNNRWQLSDTQCDILHFTLHLFLLLCLDCQLFHLSFSSDQLFLKSILFVPWHHVLDLFLEFIEGGVGFLNEFHFLVQVLAHFDGGEVGLDLSDKFVDVLFHVCVGQIFLIIINDGLVRILLA